MMCLISFYPKKFPVMPKNAHFDFNVARWGFCQQNWIFLVLVLSSLFSTTSKKCEDSQLYFKRPQKHLRPGLVFISVRQTCTSQILCCFYNVGLCHTSGVVLNHLILNAIDSCNIYISKWNAELFSHFTVYTALPPCLLLRCMC